MRRTLTTVFLALALAGAGLTYALQEATAPAPPASSATGSDDGLLGAVERAAADAADATEEACRALVESLGLDSHDCDLQGDGGHAGDASDICEEPHPMLEPTTHTSGLLPPTDPEDDYAYFVDDVDVGRTFEVGVYANGTVAAKAVHRLHVIVHGPGCGYVVATGTDYGYANVATFVAQEPGVHTIQVLPGDPEPEKGMADVLGPRTAGCHPGCVEPINEATGYELKVE